MPKTKRKSGQKTGGAANKGKPARVKGNKSWVEDPSVKGGGYWREMKGSKSKQSGVVGERRSEGGLGKKLLAAGAVAALAGAGVGAAVAIDRKRKQDKQDKTVAALSESLNEIQQESKIKLNGAKAAVIGATALAGGTAAGIAINDTAAYLNLQKKTESIKWQYSKNKDGWPDKEVYDYYDTLKPGDMIRKNIGQGMQHYAVYMGKDEKGQHYIFDSSPVKSGSDQFKAQLGVNKIENHASPENSAYQRVPDEEIYDSPDAKKYSREEIMDRIKQISETNFEWNPLNSNCESIARIIVAGDDRTTQGEKFSWFTGQMLGSIINTVTDVAAVNRLVTSKLPVSDKDAFGNKIAGDLPDEDAFGNKSPKGRTSNEFWSIVARQGKKKSKDIAKQLDFFTANQRRLADIKNIKTDSVVSSDKQANVFDNELYFDENGLRRPDIVLDSINAIEKHMNGNLSKEIKVALIKNYLVLLFSILSEGRAIPELPQI